MGVYKFCYNKKKKLVKLQYYKKKG
ncbi:hypothetical protein IIV6-T1_035 [Invertebrate iridescent virus 6]|nr:hypothetical protein IIV6-T1_035 [Invertebrate iridescent virus 6]